jgi:ABC-type nitrate/sulfonate/bicarbonate transport system substrate-binding protein
MRKILALLALCLLVSPSFAGESLKEVKWGHIASTAFYWDVYAARDLGFMKDQGLHVQAIRIDSASQSIPQVLAGGVDILSSNPELAISAIKKGGDLVIIGNETAIVPWALMSRPEIKSIKDLKGKVVGVTQLKQASTTMTRLLLKRAGLKPSDYKVIQLGGTPNRYAALSRGAVAATLLAQPADFKAEDQGMRRLAFTDEVFKGPAIVFVARRTWLKENGDVARRFLKGAVAGMHWFNDRKNRQKAIDILVKSIKVTPDLAARTYDLFLKKGVISKDGTLPLQHVENYIKVAQDGHTAMDPAKFVDFSYLKAAKK